MEGRKQLRGRVSPFASWVRGGVTFKQALEDEKEEPCKCVGW